MRSLLLLGGALLSFHGGHAARVEAVAPVPCPVGVPVQTITVVNQANVRPQNLAKVEAAVGAQSLQVRAAWGTPCVQFGRGGWLVYLQTGYEPQAGGGYTMQLGGNHYPSPYAVVRTGGLPYTGWSTAFSHEVAEMLVDPSTTIRWRFGLLEICDPVENWSYRIGGVPVNDFVMPSYFSAGPGPWDQMGMLSTPFAV